MKIYYDGETFDLAGKTKEQFMAEPTPVWTARGYTDISIRKTELWDRYNLPPEEFKANKENGLYDRPHLKIKGLKEQLAATDYRIIKYYEYQMAGLELPYDIETLHTERQAIRDRINELEGGL